MRHLIFVNKIIGPVELSPGQLKSFLEKNESRMEMISRWFPAVYGISEWRISSADPNIDGINGFFDEEIIKKYGEFHVSVRKI